MIEINQVSKSFGTKKVLDEVNLRINKGETKVIIGRSGVGKSVLLKCIAGLISLDGGSIKIDGQDITSMPRSEFNTILSEMGLVFQGGALFDSMTVGENVGFVLNEFMSLDAKTVRDKVADALGLVGLHGIEQLMPSNLSGGMRKRVSIARVLCMEPQIILYDEPTTGVDPITADSLNELINDLRDKLKVTAIVVTHDMSSAYKVADRIAMLYHGKVISEGSPDEIRHSDNPFVRQFVNGDAAGPITEDDKMTFGHPT